MNRKTMFTFNDLGAGYGYYKDNITIPTETSVYRGVRYFISNGSLYVINDYGVICVQKDYDNTDIEKVCIEFLRRAAIQSLNLNYAKDIIIYRNPDDSISGSETIGQLVTAEDNRIIRRAINYFYEIYPHDADSDTLAIDLDKLFPIVSILPKENLVLSGPVGYLTKGESFNSIGEITVHYYFPTQRAIYFHLGQHGSKLADRNTKRVDEFLFTINKYEEASLFGDAVQYRYMDSNGDVILGKYSLTRLGDIIDSGIPTFEIVFDSSPRAEYILTIKETRDDENDVTSIIWEFEPTPKYRDILKPFYRIYVQ